MKKIYYKIVLFFHNIYVSWLKWHTMRLIAKATAATTKLLPILGKDPNYVPPPPPPAPPAWKPVDVDESKAAWIVDHKERRPVQMQVGGSYTPWVKDPSTHPILAARKQFEKNQAELEASRKKPVVEENLPMVTQTTEIGGEAVDALREAVKNVEEACGIEGCGCKPDKKE